MFKERLKSRKLHSKPFEIQLMECVLLILLFLLSYDLAWGFIYNNFFPYFLLDQHLRDLTISALIVIILGFYRHFHFMDRSYTEAVKKIAAAGLLINSVLIIFLYFFSAEKIPQEFFLEAYLLQIMLLILLKYFTGLIRRFTLKGGLNLLVTKDAADGSLVKALKKEYGGRLTVVSYQSDGLKQYVEEADNIYVTGSVTREFRNQLLSFCTLKDKKICIIPEIFEIAVRNSAVSFIGDSPVFTLECLSLTEAQRFAKRAMDIFLSVLGIAVSLPIILLVAIGIKWEDHGPVFYRQERAGLNGKPFEVIKFRSMVVDAEKETGAVLASENDRRITRIGHFIRSARIDEIPQFFNVLSGAMSLIGPRPERPVFVEEFGRRYPEYCYRISVKPGITGLAQVRGNYTSSAENKLKFDLMYIMNYSFLLDIKILFQTVKVVLKREQAKGFLDDGTENHNETVGRAVFIPSARET